MGTQIPPWGGGPGSGPFPPLLQANNLGDVNNAALARVNLGVGGISTSGSVTTVASGLLLAGFRVAGLLQVSASGVVSANTAAVAASASGNFTADHRLTLTVSGVTYYLPISTVAW